MKKSLYFAVVAIIATLSTGCFATSANSSTVSATKGDTEISLPLSGPEYRSNKDYWRSVQMGTSPNMAMAKKVAMQNARQELASTIESEVKSMMESYGRNVDIDAQSKYESIYEELTRTVVNQKLAGVEVIEEKIFKTEAGAYNYYVCMQVSKREVEEEIVKELSNDQILNTEFERERFRKAFNEEFDKFANGEE
jgi:hypothetical protein